MKIGVLLEGNQKSVEQESKRYKICVLSSEEKWRKNEKEICRLLGVNLLGNQESLRMKVRKGNVGTSVEWRLNSENDSRLHGQPSLSLLASHAWSFIQRLVLSKQCSGL